MLCQVHLFLIAFHPNLYTCPKLNVCPKYKVVFHTNCDIPYKFVHKLKKINLIKRGKTHTPPHPGFIMAGPYYITITMNFKKTNCTMCRLETI